jgi:hypothetical protein
MVNRYEYLPEYTVFEYTAQAPWPRIYTDYQQDWVTAVTTLEQWLNQYVGSHWSEWAYTTRQEHQAWEACVAFRRESMCTLFLLRWS